MFKSIKVSSCVAVSLVELKITTCGSNCRPKRRVVAVLRLRLVAELVEVHQPSAVEVARGVSWRHRKGFINQASAITGQARNDDTSIAFALFFYFLSCNKKIHTKIVSVQTNIALIAANIVSVLVGIVLILISIATVLMSIAAVLITIVLVLVCIASILVSTVQYLFNIALILVKTVSVLVYTVLVLISTAPILISIVTIQVGTMPIFQYKFVFLSKNRAILYCFIS